MQSSARNWFDKQESRQMGNQYWYLTYFMTSQQQVHAEHAMLDTHLSSQYVKDKNKLKTDLYGIFQSSNRSNFFMDFWYKKYAGNQKGCTFRMPVYGVKGHSGKISRMLNYSEIFFGSEEGMNAEAFGDLIFGTKCIREEETVTDTAPLVEEAQGNAVSRSIASEDAEAVCKVLEKLWEAQETSPDTRFIILMEDAENKSMELLRELYLMLPNRLRLQMGFQTNITQADLNQIRNNNGLPIYVLTAERKDFKELTEAYPFPIVIYDMTQADAYTYDEDRLKLLRDLARKTDGKTITKLSYAERKVIETKEGIASSFKYYREVVTEMDNDRLYWWKNKEIASIGELTEALKDQKELMGNQELLDESLLAFFKQMIPEGTYAEQIIDLIQDESNPDRDTILETLGSSLCISKEIDAVKALIDKLKEEKTKALAEKEAAEREQKALELAAQQKSYEEEIRKKMADHEAEMKSVQDTHAAELKAKEEAAATVQKALDEKSRLFDKVCETNKSNAETVQALKATVSQKDKEIAQRDSDLAQLRKRMSEAGTQDVEALQEDLEKAEKKVKRTVSELEETQGKKKLFTALTGVFGILTVAGIAAAAGIFILKSADASKLQAQIDDLTGSRTRLMEQISEAEYTGEQTRAALEQKLSEKQSEIESMAAAESERVAALESEALAAQEAERVTEGEKSYTEGGETWAAEGEDGSTAANEG